MKPKALPRTGRAGDQRRARPTKNRSPVRTLKPEQCSQQLASDILLAGALSFLVQSGVPKQQLAHDLDEAAARIRSGRPIRRPRSSDYQTMLGVADVVHDWCWDSVCTDVSTGKPLPLRLDQGNRTLREIISNRFPDRQAEMVLAWMEANGTVARQVDGSFALTRHWVLLGESNALMMERAATLATEYLETALHNSRTRDRSDRNLDCTARVSDLPEKYVPQFRAMVREQMQTFLNTVDNWLESRRASNSGEATVDAAVHSYAYVGPRKTRRSRDENVR